MENTIAKIESSSVIVSVTYRDKYKFYFGRKKNKFYEPRMSL